MLQQIIVVVSLCIYILILILGLRKSRTAASDKKRPVERWAIIGREFVEFTAEETEWREFYGREK